MVGVECGGGETSKVVGMGGDMTRVGRVQAW